VLLNMNLLCTTRQKTSNARATQLTNHLCLCAFALLLQQNASQVRWHNGDDH
jgi:hypothetical protein